MKQFVFTEWNKKKLGILFEDGKAMEIRCYEADSILGNVYRARVSNLSPNINAAFVDCYLSMDDYHGEKLKVGDLVTVQVVRDKIKTKRYAVTTDISLQGDYAVTTLFAPVGVSSKITDSARKKELKTLMQNLLIAEQDAQFYLAEGNVAEIERIKKLTFGGIIRTQAEHAEDAAITREIEGQARLLYSIMKKSEYATQYTCLPHGGRIYQRYPADACIAGCGDRDRYSRGDGSNLGDPTLYGRIYTYASVFACKSA